MFTRRARLHRTQLGLSTVGGQASLKTLLDEPDFALAAFLLSVLGEGSFLNLLWFLMHHAPDPITRQICRLAATDEARHVAFGMAHLGRHAQEDPSVLGRLETAVRSRHAALEHTAGLNEEVFDALVLEDSTLLVIRRESFLQLMKQDSDLAVKLMWQLLSRMSHLVRITTQKLVEESITLSDLDSSAS